MDLNISLANKDAKKLDFIYISSKEECFDRRDFDETKYMSFLLFDKRCRIIRKIL